MWLYIIDSPPFVSAGYSEINKSERDVIKLCYFPFECSDFFVQVLLMSHTPEGGTAIYGLYRSVPL